MSGLNRDSFKVVGNTLHIPLAGTGFDLKKAHTALKGFPGVESTSNKPGRPGQVLVVDVKGDTSSYRQDMIEKQLARLAGPGSKTDVPTPATKKTAAAKATSRPGASSRATSTTRKTTPAKKATPSTTRTSEATAAKLIQSKPDGTTTPSVPMSRAKGLVGKTDVTEIYIGGISELSDVLKIATRMKDLDVAVFFTAEFLGKCVIVLLKTEDEVKRFIDTLPPKTYQILTHRTTS